MHTVHATVDASLSTSTSLKNIVLTPQAHTLSGKPLWTAALPSLTTHTDCSLAANGSMIYALCSTPGCVKTETLHG